MKRVWNRCTQAAFIGAGCCVWAVAVAWSGIDVSRWRGKAGDELMTAVAVDCAPQHLVKAYGGDGGKWALLRGMDADVVGTGYLNRFSLDPLAFGSSSDGVPADACLLGVVDGSWWLVSAQGAVAMRHDLHNLWAAPLFVPDLKGALPPGIVDESEFDNGVLVVGRGEIGDERCRMWQPPCGYEGDVARIMMYMLTVYHVGLEGWGGAGMRYVDSDAYPVLTVAGARQLLAWHRADPVDAAEQMRTEAVADVQGNSNPFVEVAELAEYLWGNRRGDAFALEDIPKPGDDAAISAPLRARYRLSDSRINLVSTCVPDDCRWSVDGVVVSASFVTPASLGLGRHELRFANDRLQGKVIIDITE